MVAKHLQGEFPYTKPEEVSPWPRVPAELFETRRSSSSTDAVREYVDQIQNHMRQEGDTTRKLREFRLAHEHDVQIDGLESWQERGLFEALGVSNLVASNIARLAAAVLSSIDALRMAEQCGRASVGEVDVLVQELSEWLDLLRWYERAQRSWVEQVGDELKRRHPEWEPLPFEAVDLGPSDASRLPPVL